MGEVRYHIASKNDLFFNFHQLQDHEIMSHRINLQKNAEVIGLPYLDMGLYADVNHLIFLSTKMSSKWLKLLINPNDEIVRVMLYDELVAIKPTTDILFLDYFKKIDEVDKKWLVSAKVYIDFCINHKLDIPFF